MSLEYCKMMRKLKNILNPRENTQSALYDVHMANLANSKNKPGSPVSFIKKSKFNIYFL